MTRARGSRIRTLAAAFAATVSAAGLLASPWGAGAAVPKLVSVQIIDRESGEAAPVWRHAARRYVAGRPGDRYSLKVTNNSSGRVLVVLSVDGVNVLTGQTAAYGQSGYVFSPYETYEVTGWRKSDAEVAAFTFAPLPRSYAALTGRPHDVGVIGYAAFAEKILAPPEASVDVGRARDRAEARRMDEALKSPPAVSIPPAAPPSLPSAKTAPSPLAEKRSDKLGTGHGRREGSAVTAVAFDRASAAPQLVGRIEYDSYENLLASGVIPHARPIPPWTRPFPLSPEGDGYVPDPPG